MEAFYYIFRDANGKHSPPVTEGELFNYAKRGVVQSDTEVFDRTRGLWIKATGIPALASILSNQAPGNIGSSSGQWGELPDQDNPTGEIVAANRGVVAAENPSPSLTTNYVSPVGQDKPPSKRTDLFEFIGLWASVVFYFLFSMPYWLLGAGIISKVLSGLIYVLSGFQPNADDQQSIIWAIYLVSPHAALLTITLNCPPHAKSGVRIFSVVFACMSIYRYIIQLTDLTLNIPIATLVEVTILANIVWACKRALRDIEHPEKKDAPRTQRFDWVNQRFDWVNTRHFTRPFTNITRKTTTTTQRTQTTPNSVEVHMNEVTQEKGQQRPLPNFPLVTIGGIGAILFLVFVWPTPYVYTQKAPDVWRVNRFTGIKYKSTPEGWKSEKEINAEQASVDRYIAQLKSEEQETNAVLAKAKKSSQDLLRQPIPRRSVMIGSNLQIRAEVSTMFDIDHQVLHYILTLTPHFDYDVSSSVVITFTDSNGFKISNDDVPIVNFNNMLGQKKSSGFQYEGTVAMSEQDYQHIMDINYSWRGF